MADSTEEPVLELRDTFYIGGQYLKDARGTHMTGQMCVRRYGRKSSPDQPAIVYIHGAGQTGTHYEFTPDGRPGLALLQARAGWECFVVDQPGVGRSRYHADDLGELTHYTVEELQAYFTSPPRDSWPQANLHTQWPGSGQMGDPTFDAFYASQVGHLSRYRNVENLFRPVARALLERTGPAFLVTHSQSGPLGWHVADECGPSMVRGIVALEPNGPPFIYPGYPGFYTRTQGVPAGTKVRPFGITTTRLHYDPPLAPDAKGLEYTTDPSAVEKDGLVPGARLSSSSAPLTLPNLRDVPIVVVTAEASYHATYDHLTVQFLHDVGVRAEHIYLADRGVRGNGHLLAIEKNNVDVQLVIGTWLDETWKKHRTPEG